MPAMELPAGVTSALPPKTIVVPVVFSSAWEATSGSSLGISITFPPLSADVATGWATLFGRDAGILDVSGSHPLR